MNRKVDKEIVNQFTARLKKKYDTIDEIIYHLIDRSVITEKRLRDYMIVKDFYEYKANNDVTHTTIFAKLSIKYSMSHRRVKDAVYNYTSEFILKSNIA